MAKVTQHPKTFERFAAAAKRLMVGRVRLEDTHRKAVAGLWLTFDSDEIALLEQAGYLSEFDRQIIATIQGRRLREKP